MIMKGDFGFELNDESRFLISMEIVPHWQIPILLITLIKPTLFVLSTQKETLNQYPTCTTLLGGTVRKGKLTISMLTLVLSLLLVSIASPLFAQMESDRPTPPGTKPPVTLFTRLADAGNAEDYPDFDHIVVYDHSINKVIDSGITYVDLYLLTKVLTEQGCLDQSAIRWDYDPNSSFIEVAEVNIVRGEEIIPVSTDDIIDLPAPQSAIYWNNRIKVLQLPRLQVGDGIEVKAMRKGYNYALLADVETDLGAQNRIAAEGDDRYIPPMAGHYFDIVLFQGDVPIVEKKYILELPSDKRLISEVYNGPIYAKTSYDAEKDYYTWWSKDVPALKGETRMPDASDMSPKVVMTTAESWEAKSQWFFDVNKNQFEVTPDITEKVNQIIADYGATKGSDMDKAKALNHWVAQNIRYSGQPIPVGEGFTLHPSDLLFENRSGVCKDIASMSITFLRAAGFNAYPAMTMAGSRIEDIPADQFNHCVVAWEREDGSFTMLDPTWVPFNNDIWSKLETEQHYVIGHPDGVDLGQIRYSPPEESPLKIAHNATLGMDGSLTGKIRFDGEGALDSRLRRIVYQRSMASLPDYVASLLSEMGDGITNIEVTHRKVDDFTGYMWWEVNYTIKDYAKMVDGGLEFKPGLLNVVKDHAYLFRAGSVGWGEERENDIFLYYTQRLDITENIKLPKGFSLANEVENVSLNETYAAFDASIAMERKGLKISSLTDVRRRQIPPSGYQGFKKVIDEMDDWAGTTVRVTKGGAK